MSVSTGGPSPRGRGNLVDDRDSQRAVGSIPAWAGKPRWGYSRWGAVRVHPRVGGETFAKNAPMMPQCGPSPRGRGNRVRRRGVFVVVGSIPAWAGKPRDRRLSDYRAGVHPRVGGETADLITFGDVQCGPSPRGRGNPLAGTPKLSIRGSIPAWAGKPHGQRGERGCVQVHPRVGGETREAASVFDQVLGPSPRGRGNR